MRLLIFLSVLLVSSVSAETVSSSNDLYLGSRKTKLYYSFRCDEAKKMAYEVLPLEFGTPDEAERAGFKAGECTLSRPDLRSELLFDSVIKAREGVPTDLPYGVVSPYDTYVPLPSGSSAGNCSGKVVGIADGDTVSILNRNNQEIKVRLAGIDAPERGQAFGQAAKSHLSNLIFGQHVECDGKKTDGYGRTIGKIRLLGKDVNLQMVQDGMAWHYKKYEREQSAEDRSAYSAAEVVGRGGRYGLWRDLNPAAPSDYRAAFNPDYSYPTYSGEGAGASPTNSSGPGSGVPVRTYTRRDGTVVRSHTRSSPKRR